MTTEKHTPEQWTACGNGKCSCKQVNAEDGPVCTVESGEWGDRFPVLRVEGVPGSVTGELTIRAEMDIMAYGKIDTALAESRALLIAAAPDLLAACEAVLTGYDNPDNDAAFDWPATAEQLRAAIAKAKGESK